MNLIEKIYFRLFTKSSEIIITKDGNFEFKLPKGYRYTNTKGLYQIINPSNKSYLLQWQGLILNDDDIFNSSKELEFIHTTNPNALLQNTGNYDCICAATIYEDKNQISIHG